MIAPILAALLVAAPQDRSETEAALKKAVTFFRTKVATEGGYLWLYSEDLIRGEGERRAGRETVWVQPPGTPAVGLAYLHAYRATGDRSYLEAARETANALIRGQLQSGGWDYRIEFNPKERARYAYRADGRRSGRNTTTLDDDTTQAALRLLMQADAALKFKDKAIHEAARYALDALVRAQYPNGAWPQRFEKPPDPALHPVRKADYPMSWSRTWPGGKYQGHYTFNDNAIADMIGIMLDASEIYGEGAYRKAAEKAGDFIRMAQMPDPQPAWAQQYDAGMKPAWARKFEPPSVTGGESQGVLQTLLMLYRRTGEKRFLEPLPAALEYLRRSRLPGRRLARFYELRTNKALYFTRDYVLTYSDDDLPTHYAFKVGDKLDRIAREYERIKDLPPDELKRERRVRMSKKLAGRARKAIESLDSKGRWVEEGRLKRYGKEDPARRIIDCGTFVQNIGILCDFLTAAGD